MSPELTMASEPPFIIARDAVGAWVKRLQQTAEVIAPVKGPGGDEIFQSISDPEEILWEFVNPLDPPKRLLLPQTEPLARIEKSNGAFEVEALFDERPRVLLNVRSCDQTGLPKKRRRNYYRRKLFRFSGRKMRKKNCYRRKLSRFSRRKKRKKSKCNLRKVRRSSSGIWRHASTL